MALDSFNDEPVDPAFLSEGADFGLNVSGRPSPPIGRTAAALRYYNIHILPAGFPARRRSDGSLYEHPLYPIYLLEGYLKQFERDGSKCALASAALVAEAALKRAVPFGETLVF